MGNSLLKGCAGRLLAAVTSACPISFPAESRGAGGGLLPVMDLAGQVLGRPEYRDAPRVFVIVDKGSDHRGQPPPGWPKAHPNAIMVHTPVHASWLN